MRKKNMSANVVPSVPVVDKFVFLGKFVFVGKLPTNINLPTTVGKFIFSVDCKIIILILHILLLNNYTSRNNHFDYSYFHYPEIHLPVIQLLWKFTTKYGDSSTNSDSSTTLIIVFS